MATDQNNNGSVPGDDPFSDWAEALEEQKQTDDAHAALDAEQGGPLSGTPAYIGGLTDRGAPCYGEDNAAILGGLLGMDAAEIAQLARDGVI